MKKCSECDYRLEKWMGSLFLGYICRKNYENVSDENNPPCQNKENNNE